MIGTNADPGASEQTMKCECGATKEKPNAKACNRCRYLDGETMFDAAVISALRDNGNSTLLELCEAIGMDTGKQNGRRSMLRRTQGLMRKKRVRRYWREGDRTAASENVDAFSRAARFKGVAARGAWVYALDGMTADGR